MVEPEIALLVSVRSGEEAEAALVGGADLVDVKEPERGPLGRASDAVVAEVVSRVADRCLVSAALGELTDFEGPIPSACAFVKWGLSGMTADWEHTLEELRRRARPAQGVIVAYADWQCAGAPAVDDVVAFACRHPGSVLLIDTACKHERRAGRRATLLDWQPLPWLSAILREARRADVRVALAGSLGHAEIEQVRVLRPDWIAVRGAACVDSERHATICSERVRALKKLLVS